MFGKTQSPYQLVAKKMADIQRIKPSQLTPIPGVDMKRYAKELGYLSAFLVCVCANRQLSGNGKAIFLETFDKRIRKTFDMNEFSGRAANYEFACSDDFETSAKNLSKKFAEFVGYPDDETIRNLSETSILYSFHHYDDAMLQLTISSAMEGFL